MFIPFLAAAAVATTTVAQLGAMSVQITALGSSWMSLCRIVQGQAEIGTPWSLAVVRISKAALEFVCRVIGE